MKRITIYSDGNWYAENKEGIELNGMLEGELLKSLIDVVENADDPATAKIKKAKKEAEKAKEKAEETVKEVVTPFRSLLEKADDETVLENSRFIERFELDKEYKVNNLFRYEDKVYRVIQEHTSQADWIPGELPALYQDLSREMDEDGNEVISEWQQPAGAHDAYKKGTKVLHEGKEWILEAETTVYPPGTVAGEWKEV